MVANVAGVWMLEILVCLCLLSLHHFAANLNVYPPAYLPVCSPARLQLLLLLLGLHSLLCTSVEFLPRSQSTGDGPFACFGGPDGVIRVLSLATWQVSEWRAECPPWLHGVQVF